MIFVKFIILIFLFFICLEIGILKSKVFEYRLEELNSIKNALVFFKSKLEFTYEPINDIFLEISKSIYFEHDNVFKRCIVYLEKFDLKDAWQMAVSDENKINIEDKNVLYNFGKLLGKTDLNGQISEILLALEFLDKQIVDAENLKNKNCKLYKSLGAFAGIGLSIMLM